MKSIIAIGDIHNKTGRAEEICDRFPNHIKIFVGDYFDDFGDTPSEASMVASWLKKSLKKKDRIHLMGNHDFAYRVNSKNSPTSYKVFCSGYSSSKQQEIDKVLTESDWNKIKYFHYKYGWFFSHAGLTLEWFGNPMDNTILKKNVKKIIEKNLLDLKSGIFPSSIWSADFFRGGLNSKGGILWNDWRNLDLISGIKQIVGHTPFNSIQKKNSNDQESLAINIDTNLKEVIEILPNGTVREVLDLL